MTITHKPFIIPVFLPNVGCPHQCAFCNQTAITGKKRKTISAEKLGSYINEFLNYRRPCRKGVQIAFYGGNFLGLKSDYAGSLLNEASKFVSQGKVDSIRFSTRPDTVNNERLDSIKDFPVATIELGVQSMDDRVLTMAMRGHSSVDTEKAVCLLKERNYEIGLQMMVGLPGDDETGALETGRRIAEMKPGFVRIYPTVVLVGSVLADWYKKGEYVPLPLEQCVTLVKNLYLLFKKNRINVIRMGLQASEGLDKRSTMLAGPYHPAFGDLVYSEIFLDKAESILESKEKLHDIISIKVNPKNISKMRGLKNRNIKILKQKFHVRSVEIIPDMTLSENMLEID
ncbi:MAG TPA: radical SAM protein [Anaerolineae bacterium]|nr:radical SAM protein [Anaerolineae bacterium]